jgi:hypothetical protein
MMEKNFELYGSAYPIELMKDMEFGSRFVSVLWLTVIPFSNAF